MYFCKMNENKKSDEKYIQLFLDESEITFISRSFSNNDIFFDLPNLIS